MKREKKNAVSCRRHRNGRSSSPFFLFPAVSSSPLPALPASAAVTAFFRRCPDAGGDVLKILNLRPSGRGTFQKKRMWMKISQARAYQISGVAAGFFSHFSQHVHFQPFTPTTRSAVFPSDRNGLAVRASRGCNGALTASSRGRRCTTRAAPL